MIGRRLVAAMVGGVLGTWLRWGVVTALPVTSGSFPTATFIVNMVGAACIGVVVAALVEGRRSRPVATSFVGTGILGGLTTFSAFSVETVELVRVDHVPVAALYVIASITGGVALAWTGLLLTRRRLDPTAIDRWGTATGAES